MTLRLVETTGSAPSTGDGETQDEAYWDLDPEPPEIVTNGITKDYAVGGAFRWIREESGEDGPFPSDVLENFRRRWVVDENGGDLLVKRRLYFAVFTWGGFDDVSGDNQGRLLGFAMKRWHKNKGDFDKPIKAWNVWDFDQIQTGTGIGKYVVPFYCRSDKGPWAISIQAYVEGYGLTGGAVHSAWSDPGYTVVDQPAHYIYAFFSHGAPGIYRSADDGVNWTMIEGQAVYFPTATSIRGLGVNKSTGRIYVPYGGVTKVLYYSDDAGVTFSTTTVDAAATLSVRTVTMATLPDEGFYVPHVVLDDTGKFVYHWDGESTWAQGATDLGVITCKVSTSGANVDHAIAYNTAAVWYSVDAVSSATPTWTRIRNASFGGGNVKRVYFDPDDDTIVWVCHGSGLARCVGGEAVWTAVDTMLADGESAINDGNDTNYRPANLAYPYDIKKNGSTYWSVGAHDGSANPSIFHATDPTSSWTGVGANNTDLYEIVFNPWNGDYMTATGASSAGPDVGVHVTSDGGATWTQYTTGISTCYINPATNPTDSLCVPSVDYAPIPVQIELSRHTTAVVVFSSMVNK